MPHDASARESTGALWAVVPAAGEGSRMKRGHVPPTLPKQYVTLAGQSLIERVLETLLSLPNLEGVVVALAPGDEHFETLAVASDCRVHVTTGGSTRAGSVSAALGWLRAVAADHARVLVHDAARPLVSPADIRRLIEAVDNGGGCGGLLAVPVQDTLKRANGDHQVTETVSRERLWQAQTPQLFRLGELADALSCVLSRATAGALQDGSLATSITDEASAMESQGHAPQLVEALDPNPKITRLADLAMAEAWLTREIRP